MGNRKLQTCFISAPRSVDLAPLREELSVRGVMSWDDASVLIGSYVRQTLESAIADVDFVCAVVPDGPADPNVLLEVGVAIGAHQPLLLFAAPKAELPATLRALPYARASLKDTEAVRFHLDAFLKNAGKIEGTRKNGHRAQERPLSPTIIATARNRIDSWEAQATPPEERDLIEFLAGVFEAMGWVNSTSSSPSGHSKKRADLAVWVDDLQAIAGNPLLIEVVGRAAPIPEKVRQFQQQLLETHGSIGLLVRWGEGGTSYVPDDWRWPVIVLMSVREVIEALGRGDFAQSLLARRNAAVHSAA
jgi:hypothetical protein